MSDRLEIQVGRAQEVPRAAERAAQVAKAMTLAGHRVALIVESLKSREQERLYHSCFRDLARDCLLGGLKQDTEAWKRALLQAFYEETANDPEFADDWRTRAPRMVPELHGRGLLMVNVESKKFSVRLARGFIEFVHSVGAERGVRWSRTSLGRDVPDELFAEAA